MILAGGGVVWRPGASDLEVAVIHRPRRNDWSLPKGKLERGETIIECALREVLEETGLVCSVGEELASSRYRHRSGRVKLVRYWEMRPVHGTFTPNAEADEMRWIPLGEAPGFVTRTRDADVIASFAASLATATSGVRHR